MAVVRIPDSNRTFDDDDAARAHLRSQGIAWERWQPSRELADGASADEVLAAYAPDIDRLKARGGYVTADVIDVFPDTPNLDAMLAKFAREHWHDEDEVRFILEGRGVFYIRSQEDRTVTEIEVGPGDLLRVPRGTWHWFHLCTEHRIRAIRLFQDPSGWTPHYTDSGVDDGYQPLCWAAAAV